MVFLLLSPVPRMFIYLILLSQHLKDFEGLILPTSHPLHEVVERITTSLLKGNQDLHQIRDKTWTIHVVNKDIKNAFVLPVRIVFFKVEKFSLFNIKMRWKKLTGNLGFHDILTLSNTYPLLLDSYSSCVLNNQATTSLNLCFLTRKDISAESMLQVWQYNFKPALLRGLTTFFVSFLFWKGERGYHNVHSRNFSACYVGLHNKSFFHLNPCFT